MEKRQQPQEKLRAAVDGREEQMLEVVDGREAAETQELPKAAVDGREAAAAGAAGGCVG